MNTLSIFVLIVAVVTAVIITTTTFSFADQEEQRQQRQQEQHQHNVVLQSVLVDNSKIQNKSGPCRANCTPRGFGKMSQCKIYDELSVTGWIPFNYGRAAYCACSQLPNSAVSPSSACVREKLHNFTFVDENPDYFNTSLRNQIGEWKSKMCKATDLVRVNDTVVRNSSEIVWCSWTFYEKLNSVQFPKRLHDMHAAAYEQCCCPGKPAGASSWWLIMPLGYALSLYCPLELFTIEMFGKCGCGGW